MIITNGSIYLHKFDNNDIDYENGKDDDNDAYEFMYSWCY